MSTQSSINDGLPVNLDDLIHVRSIENSRIEFKATWSQYIRPAVNRTICAFANDLLNLNGGYIILGIEEEDNGKIILPPRGLDSLNVDDIQRQIRADCSNIEPTYYPVLVPATFENKSILIIWVPGGDNRPYQALEEVARSGSPKHYYVKVGSETIKAKDDVLRQLMECAAKIPFDDRRHQNAKIEDLSPLLVRSFLHDVRSELVESGKTYDDIELFKSLRIVAPVNAHLVPRNVGLLFYSESPDLFFPSAKIEVVQFGDDSGGDLIEEKIFTGPVNIQIKRTLDYLDSLGGTQLKKIPRQAEVERTVPYPYEAMEEAIVNALYHRSYESPPEPTKIYLYPDRMEITSYPGPVPGIQMQHLSAGAQIPSVPARNRRIGELLKELRLAEGRGTGIPKIQRKMAENGSPEAIFDFDTERTYFRVILPVHPRYKVLHSIREASHLWALGEKEKSLSSLIRSYEKEKSSGALASQIIEYSFNLGKIDLANKTMAIFKEQVVRNEPSLPFLTMARVLIDNKREAEAGELLRDIPATRTISDTVEAAILKKRARDYEGAHQLFQEAFSINPDDPKIVHEFAQTKIHLARPLFKRQDRETKRRINREALELLRRATQLIDDTEITRKAWCWFDMARTLEWLREPHSEVEKAYLSAMQLLSSEKRFKEAYDRWRNKTTK